MDTIQSGHSPSQPGLQEHSMGKSYPFMASYKGKMDNPKGWYVWNAVNDDFKPIYNLTCTDAHNLADGLADELKNG